MPKLYECARCLNEFSSDLGQLTYTIDNHIVCSECFNIKLEKEQENSTADPTFNKPKHYHQQEMDTIEFLQKGFAPQVFIGFAVGSAVKYLHRYEEKNGYEDLDKAIDYIDRLKAFLKEKDLL